ncbi:YitT family protein [Eggerthella sp. YY7918]|uniref:YczE/YyaS/YitT family protein n=1 Tax=Eggerthella sp. (strain YY7918) TaxID=502558 RepID=UPI0012472551|nr:DUF6198 family protein [Eggerthella sp. YY7918]
MATTKTIVMRACLLSVGILIMSAGIALITKTYLGTSPISSFGYVLSIAFPQISYGVFMTAWNIVLLLGQVVILRRNFRASALLQLPISVLFSIGLDGFSYLFSFVRPETYPGLLVMLFCGIAMLAFGVSCTVVANIVMSSGEAFVWAITSTTGWNFGHTKIGFDLFSVALAAVASWFLLGSIQGIREGTLAAAIFTGLFANVFIRLMGGAREPLPKRSSSDQKHDTNQELSQERLAK